MLGELLGLRGLVRVSLSFCATDVDILRRHATGCDNVGPD